MNPKRSVIRLPIDAASYPRRTESSASPLRKPQKLTQVSCYKSNILVEWCSNFFSCCFVVFLRLQGNEFVLHALFKDAATTWNMLSIVCVKWWIESESILYLLSRYMSWMNPIVVLSSNVNTLQVVECIENSNISKKHVVTLSKI
jgi:hypothetical protein